MKIMFLDDYDMDIKTVSFTKGYLLKKAERDDGKNPIIENDKCFYVKYTS